MKVVLYTYDFEPITIIDINQFALNHLKTHGIVNLAIPARLNLTPGNAVNDYISYRRVTLRSMTIYLNGKVGSLLVTQDEESALLLKAAFLPGQTAELNELQRNAFACGFISALNKLTN